MICRATTTLNKTDADGRIPAYTLDQYVRGGLCQQLMTTIRAQLTVSRSEPDREDGSSTVDFGTGLILLTPSEWRQLKTMLVRASALLPADEQTAVWQLMDAIDRQP